MGKAFPIMLIAMAALIGASAAATPIDSPLRSEIRQALDEFDEGQERQADQPDRARQLFQLAAQRLAGVIASGVQNGRLEFNLGNCYLQAGDVGRAVLHYRRAKRLISRDPMLENNLAVARSRCLTTIRPSRQSALLRTLFAWHYQISASSRSKTALWAYAAFWALLILRNFVRRRWVVTTATACAVIACATAASVALTQWTDRVSPEGVVTAMDVTVYSGPGAGYQRQFEQPLQAGVEFVRHERRGGWCEIEMADGSSGWVETRQIQLIAPEN